MINQLDIGRHLYFTNPKRTTYSIASTPPAAWAVTAERVKNYDDLLHRSLEKIFRERCLSSSDNMKEFLRSYKRRDDDFSLIEPILEQEPCFSRHFSKEELGAYSLLWIAVLAGYNNSAELLVCASADVNELFGCRFPRVIDENWNVLHVLLQMEPSLENERLVRLVIDHGADLQVRDIQGRTALHYAVLKDRFEITKKMLEKGADVNAADNEGLTPLLAAVSCNQSINNVVPLLIKHGADVFIKNRYEENILHCVVNAPGDFVVEMARVFIAKGVSLNERSSNTNQKQPIHSAVSMHHNQLVELYLDHGANVDALTMDGESPLHMAVKLYDEVITQTLLERGANVHLGRTEDDRTALHVACHELERRKFLWINFPNHEGRLNIERIRAIIRLLMSAGADVLAEDSNGKTPFSLISHIADVEKPGSRSLIKELALEKVCEPSIELKDEELIELQPTALKYYRACIDELEKMKVARFTYTCTLFKLLTENYCQVATLMRNPNFEAEFQQCDLSRFPIYAKDIRRAFERVKNHYPAMLEQEDMIHEALFDYALTDLFVDKIIYYLYNMQ